MTHTLHRIGNPEDLKEDFVVFSMACQSVNAKGSSEKIRRVFEIIQKYDPINFGDVKTGNVFKATREEMIENVRDNSYIHFVFTDSAAVSKVLMDLKKADIGMSVVVSGMVENIAGLCQHAGMRMHTVEFSGGIHGKLNLLPERPVLEVTTMCGHGLISANLVRSLVEEVRKGKKSAREASVELAKQCQCGVFNPERAGRLIERMVKPPALTGGASRK